MKESFRKAKRILATNAPQKPVEAINGCCYGREGVETKIEYKKLCGERFWSFISGVDHLYVDIIEPLGRKAKERNDEFNLEYGKVLNVFTAEFLADFCDR